MDFFTNKKAEAMIDTFRRDVAPSAVIVTDGHRLSFLAANSMNSRCICVNRGD